MKLLVIGGTGVLSGAVSKEAIRKGIEVYILNRGNKPHLIPEGAISLKADVKNTEEVKHALADKHFDSVIDFICYNKPQLQHSYELFHTYADQYIFISTTCVYDTSIPDTKNEDSPKVLKEWNYSVEKWESEEYLMSECAKNHQPYTIIRPCVTYDNTRIPYGIMPEYGTHWTLIGRILADKPVLTWDGGTARWNLIRVEDFARGVVSVIGNPKAYNEAYNVSGDDAYSWEEVLQTLASVLNHPVKTFDITSAEYKQFQPSLSGEITARSLDAVISNQKIKAINPEFKTTITLRQGIEMAVEYYKSNNYLKGINYSFDGAIDGIIRKSAKSKHADADTSFVDYLGNATFVDQIEYYSRAFSGSIRGKVFLSILKVFKKINHGK